MANHHQRRRRPRPRHLVTRAGVGRYARRLGVRRPPLSGRPLMVVACAASLVGLLLVLPSAIGAGQPASQVAVATSAPTTLPQTSGTLRTSTTRTRPRTAIGAPASTRTPTTTTSGGRLSAPAAAGIMPARDDGRVVCLRIQRQTVVDWKRYQLRVNEKRFWHD